MASQSSNGGEGAEKPVSAPINTSDAMKAVRNISNTLEELNRTFGLLNEPAEDLTSYLLQSNARIEQIEACNRKIEQHSSDVDDLLKEIESGFHDDIRLEVEGSLGQSNLKDWIREEVARQVKEQVDEQIKEHLPQSLQQQADENKRQLEEIEISLRNSEARIQNSFIQTNSIMDPLAPVLRGNGEKSPLYPPNAWSLFSYDLESAKGLSRDYELTESDNLQMNFKQFLKHIGGSHDSTADSLIDIGMILLKSDDYPVRETVPVTPEHIEYREVHLIEGENSTLLR